MSRFINAFNLTIEDSALNAKMFCDPCGKIGKALDCVSVWREISCHRPARVLEGIVAKWKTAVYRATEKPSPYWVKIKNMEQWDGKVEGHVE